MHGPMVTPYDSKSFTVQQVSNGFIVSGTTIDRSSGDAAILTGKTAVTMLDMAQTSLPEDPIDDNDREAKFRRSLKALRGEVDGLQPAAESYEVRRSVIVLCFTAEELHAVISRYIKTGMLIASA